MSADILKSISKRLNGTPYCTYYDVPIKKLAEKAKAAGVVIVYGESYDHIIMTGAYEDTFHTEKDVSDSVISSSMRTITAANVKYGITEWSFDTDIPHETFRIVYDDGEVFCNGILFTAEVGEQWKSKY